MCCSAAYCVWEGREWAAILQRPCYWYSQIQQLPIVLHRQLPAISSCSCSDCCAGAISGLHLLPVYPSTGDGGFAPTTYKEIDPDMGTWKDVERLAEVRRDDCSTSSS